MVEVFFCELGYFPKDVISSIVIFEEDLVKYIVGALSFIY
jgi:hypothetical protein